MGLPCRLVKAMVLALPQVQVRVLGRGRGRGRARAQHPQEQRPYRRLTVPTRYPSRWVTPCPSRWWWRAWRRRCRRKHSAWQPWPAGQASHHGPPHDPSNDFFVCSCAKPRQRMRMQVCRKETPARRAWQSVDQFTAQRGPDRDGVSPMLHRGRERFTSERLGAITTKRVPADHVGSRRATNLTFKSGGNARGWRRRTTPPHPPYL